MTTQDLLTHHLSAFGNNDLNAILEDYTETSEILTPEGIIKGLDNIRDFFADFFLAIPTGSDFEMKQLLISDNVAYIVWSSNSEYAQISLGSDTFIIENDKIKIHTVVSLKNLK